VPLQPFDRLRITLKKLAAPQIFTRWRFSSMRKMKMKAFGFLV